MPFCRECGAKVESEAKFCGSCGASQTAGALSSTTPLKKLKPLLIAVVVIAVVVLIFFVTQKPRIFEKHQSNIHNYVFGQNPEAEKAIASEIMNDTNKELKNKVREAVAARDYKTAIKYMDEVVAIKPDPSAYGIRGMLYYNNGNTEKAIEDLNQAIKLDSNNAEAHKALGLIKQDDGDYKDSVDELTLAIKNNPKDIESLLARSRAYRMLGDKDKAIADVKKVQKIDPKNPAAEQVLQYLQ